MALLIILTFDLRLFIRFHWSVYYWYYNFLMQKYLYMIDNFKVSSVYMPFKLIIVKIYGHYLIVVFKLHTHLPS